MTEEEYEMSDPEVIEAEIKRLLADNDRYLDDRVTLDLQALDELRSSLDADLPQDYETFLRQGGLSDMRFGDVLGPEQVLEARKWIESLGLLGLAENGCGDYYCVKRSELPDGPLYIWDHETGDVLPSYGSFLAALRKWRSVYP